MVKRLSTHSVEALRLSYTPKPTKWTSDFLLFSEVKTEHPEFYKEQDSKMYGPQISTSTLHYFSRCSIYHSCSQKSESCYDVLFIHSDSSGFSFGLLFFFHSCAPQPSPTGRPRATSGLQTIDTYIKNEAACPLIYSWDRETCVL